MLPASSRFPPSSQELSEAAATLLRIAESGIVALCMWELDRNIIEANDAYLELFGYTRDDLNAGRVDWRLMSPPEWRATDTWMLSELLAKGWHAPLEKECFTKTGARISMLVASALFEFPINPASGAPRGISVCIDITKQVRARREAEDARRNAERLATQLQRQTRELQRRVHEAQVAAQEAAHARQIADSANMAKSEFLGRMSHELRTPLNAIGGYVELLEMGLRGPLTEQQYQDLERIRRSGNYLLSIINDVLNFTRLDAGQVDVSITDVHLDTVITDLETLIGPQLVTKQLSYENNVCSGQTDCGVPAVRADVERLRQILINLLTNAMKFTEPGGRISLSCWAKNGDVFVTVGDTGRGIPAEGLEHIFEPFVQINRHLTESSQQGVGLGLAISRELARAMGGDLTVTSVLGEGSKFTLRLPRADV